MSAEPDNQLVRTVEMLEACVADRSNLALLPDELRRRLLIAAGRLSHPERDETRRLAKILRRNKRKALRDADRQAVADTEIRSARRADVFAAPTRDHRRCLRRSA